MIHPTAQRHSSLRSLISVRLSMLAALVLAIPLLSCGYPACAEQPTKRRASTQRFALLIGVNEYAQANPLEFCRQDMEALGKRLVDSGFAPENVVLLEDKSSENKLRPFKANIERQIELMLGNLQADDVVLLAFSGHGVHLDGKSYLCPIEARIDEPETLVSVDAIYKQLERCPAAFKMFLVDACRNDPRIGGRKSVTAVKEGAKQFTEAIDKPPQGIVLLNSCGPGEVSMEDKDFGHGVFMHYVLEGLAGKADANGDGIVSLSELYSFAGHGTKTYVATRYNDFQRPWLRGELTPEAMNFDLARVLASSARGGAAESPQARPQEQPSKPTDQQVKPGEVITSSIGMKLVVIPAGEFMMGSPDDEDGHEKNESPVHRVRISQPFYLGINEVTQEEYQAVTGKNPSWFSSTGGGIDEVKGLDTRHFPVEQVSWDQATEFCRKLSQLDGRDYRLPTEAEWEYACRGGTQTRFHYGDELSPQDASIRSELRRTTAVGQHVPNGFGLLDMHGNVWEWCSDGNRRYDFSGAPLVNPQGPSGRTSRVVRGGSWISKAYMCRSAYRGGDVPYHAQGFRVASSPR